jgi:AcrR family transcriptional regulator
MSRVVQMPRRDDRQARREQILDEVIRIVGERGYYGFTIQELAQRCGISNAGLLYHFGSKDQLLLDMLQEFALREADAIAMFIAKAEQDEADGVVSAKRLLNLLRTMVRRAKTHPQIGRLNMALQSQALDPSHPAYAIFRDRQSATLSFLTRQIGSHSENPEAAARQLLAVIDGLFLQWVRDDQPFNLGAEWEKAIYKILPRLAPKGRNGGTPA